MAKLRVAQEILLCGLLGESARNLYVRIVGASCDADGILEFDIEGESVPNVERVNAIVTVRQETITFEPVR